MKPVLIFARDRYPPFRVDITRLYSRYLAQSFAFHWVMQPESGTASGVFDQGNERFYVTSGKSGMIRTALARLRAAGAKQAEYAAVQCRDVIVASAPIALYCRLKGRPFFYWMSYPMELGYIEIGHRFWREKRYAEALARYCLGYIADFLLYRITLPLSRHIFVQSDQMKRDVAERGIDPIKITPVPMGFDIDSFARGDIPPTDDQLYRDKKVILYVGTLDLARRLPIPMEGAAHYVAAHSDAAVVLIGRHSPEEKGAIATIFRKYAAIDRLHFRDQLPLRSMLGHVKAAAVCLAPYPADTKPLRSATPTKLVEYIAMGARVVANAHPDQTKVASATATPVLCEYTAESFEAAISTAMALGRPSQAELVRSDAWLQQERDYGNLAILVAEHYRRTIAS